jgi:glycosyltransferase involved in cell wall biosynthesis
MQETTEANRVHHRRNGYWRLKQAKLKHKATYVYKSDHVKENNDSASGRTIAVVIPAYNEERFIGSLVIETLQIVDRVIVVDDGSSDRTAAVARLAGADVLIHNRNQGKGVALENGLAYALALDVDAVVTMDGDGQHRPNEIPDLVRPILDEEADMVIGSRFQNVKSKIPWWRQIGQHALTYVTNTTSQIRSTDSQSGFRAFSQWAIESMDLRSTGFSVESELQFIARENRWRVIESPITCIYEEKAKRNPFQQGLQVLNGILKLVSQSRPLFYFGGAGAVVALVGILWWGMIAEIYSNTGRFAIGYASLATLMIVLGVLALFQGITLQTLRGISKLIVERESNKAAAGYRVEKPDTAKVEKQPGNEVQNAPR